MADGVKGGTCRRGRQRSRRGDEPGDFIRRRIPRKARAVEVFSREVGSCWTRGSLAFEIEHLERELHPADAVGDGVVELPDETSGSALKPFHHSDLPQRPGRVEGRRRLDAGDVDDRIRITRRRCRHPSQMPVEVDFGRTRPAGRGEPQRRHLHHVVHPGDHPARPLDECP
jgi:hypothetical protein